jgi:hypothetical protein
MPKPVRKRNHGGKRVGSGRRKLNRRSVSARVSNELYAQLRRIAKARKIKLSRLIESILERAVQPDFAAFFAKHPAVPGGDDVLAGLLQEREGSLRG